ncbi:hypothetical protein HDU98_005062 [Podochytrium sp. JEL0797]|nr:hypothetical protein HDU98_005062 [Podochytrium sp. JEL0797]
MPVTKRSGGERPQSARVHASFEYAGTISTFRPDSGHQHASETASLLASQVGETYYTLRAAAQPTAPVAPAIVRTQTASSNLDGFEIEKVALRRIRFVVENNECDVEHLSMVDLVESGYSTYTTQSFTSPVLHSATTPSEIISRDAAVSTPGEGVPRELQDQHEVQALLMLTHTTSDAAANLVVSQEMRTVAAERAGNPQESIVLGRRSVASPENQRNVCRSQPPPARPQSAKFIVKRDPIPVPATCMPSRGLTPTAKGIAVEATHVAIGSMSATRRVTTPNEILDVLRQVEGPGTVLRGVVGEGWRRNGGPSVGAVSRRKGQGRGGALEEVVMRSMEQSASGRVSSGKSGSLYNRSSSAEMRKSPRLKIRLLAEEPAGGEPEFNVTNSLDFVVPPPKNDASLALSEQYLMRIIERRRAKYLNVGMV